MGVQFIGSIAMIATTATQIALSLLAIIVLNVGKKFLLGNIDEKNVWINHRDHCSFDHPLLPKRVIKGKLPQELRAIYSVRSNLQRSAFILQSEEYLHHL